MMLICIKQHLSNIWTSIHEKVKQHWGWVEKSVAYKKTVFFSEVSHRYKITFFLTIFASPPEMSEVTPLSVKQSKPSKTGIDIGKRETEKSVCTVFLIKNVNLLGWK